MRGHYPVAQGDPASFVLAAVLAVFIIAVVIALYWFLWPSLVGEA